MKAMLGFLELILLSAHTMAIDPRYAKNITVFHVNEHKFGAIPLNMDTGDAVGDMFFDMIEVIGSPFFCPNGSNTSQHGPGPNPCVNPEAVGNDLMVNKLTLEVDSRFSGYAACNVGINGSDPFHHPCKTGTYCCLCSTHTFPPKTVPCNSTLGYQNLYEMFGKWMHKSRGCRRSLYQPRPTKADCYRNGVFSKISPENPGAWYSSLEQGYCGKNSSSDCTWRVVSVDKIVQRSCHKRVFGGEVAKTAPECFEGCGDQKNNASSPCWVDCFYQAALGLDAGRPGGTWAGMSTDALVAAWQKPFLPVGKGGCPPQKQALPWFKSKSWFHGLSSSSTQVDITV
jgi:hypothetical protein